MLELYRDTALDQDLRFSVVGNMNGSYSLAAMNWRLALVLEAARPGTVRIEQIEGRPVRDLGQVPRPERIAVAELADREQYEGGIEIEISQHWPLLDFVEPDRLPARVGFLGGKPYPHEIWLFSSTKICKVFLSLCASWQRF